MRIGLVKIICLEIQVALEEGAVRRLEISLWKAVNLIKSKMKQPETKLRQINVLTTMLIN